MTEEQPVIIKKLNEISDRIADFVADPRNPANTLEITATPHAEEGYIQFQVNDFTVKIYPESGCACQHDGAHILCNEDPFPFTDSCIANKEEELLHSYGSNLFRECRVRRYLEIFRVGLQRKETEASK